MVAYETQISNIYHYFRNDIEHIKLLSTQVHNELVIVSCTLSTMNGRQKSYPTEVSSQPVTMTNNYT